MRKPSAILFLITACVFFRPLLTQQLETLIDAEVASLAAQPGTRLAVVAVLDPSGRVLALGGQRGTTVDRTLPAMLRRDPGSVMKTFTIGTAIDEGVVKATSTVSGEGGTWAAFGRTIRDVTPHGEMSIDDVLAFSSNIGTAKVFEQLGHERLERKLKALGLPTPPMNDDASSVGVSYGADIEPTPLELAKAFAAIASGEAFPNHTTEVLELMRHTVDRDDGTGRQARVKGVTVAGKTGTWAIDDVASYANFVGIVPADAPRYIVLVGVETTEKGYSGGSIAAPAFARVASALMRGAR